MFYLPYGMIYKQVDKINCADNKHDFNCYYNYSYGLAVGEVFGGSPNHKYYSGLKNSCRNDDDKVSNYNKVAKVHEKEVTNEVENVQQNQDTEQIKSKA